MVAVRAFEQAPKYAAGSIHDAVTACDLEAVKALVDEGLRQEKLAQRTYMSGLRAPQPAAFVDDVDERGIQPIHLAADLSDADIESQLALLQYLIDNGADPNETNTEDGLSPLHIAAEKNNVHVVALLLDNGADATIEDPRAMTALHLAAIKGHTETIKALVTKYPPCTSCRRVKGNTALHYAAASGHFEATLALLEGGAKPGAKNNMGATALHYAAGRGYTDIVELLLEFGADIDDRQNDGCRPLHFAAMEGHLDLLTMLMERGADREAKTEQGSTVLHCAAERGYMEILAALLDFGADVNAMQNSGNTPLMYAAAKGHEKAVRALLGADADPNHAGNNGSTPVHRAVANENQKIVGILLEAGAEVNQETLSGETPLFHAAAMGNLEMVQFLLHEEAEVNGHVNQNGDTPLHLACTHGDKEHDGQVVMELIMAGARLDIVNNEGCNPLQKGQYKLNDKIPQYLSSCTDESGHTLLFGLVKKLTSEEHSPEEVEGLRVLISDMLDYQSDPNACFDGESVLDAALAPGGSFDLDVVEMLVDPERSAHADVLRGYPLNKVIKELCKNKDNGILDPEREEFLLECIDIFANAGVDVSANGDGGTPLMMAIHSHHTTAVHRLARVGALKDTDSGNILGKLCKDLRNMSEEPGKEAEIASLGESIVTVIEAGANVNARKGKQKQKPPGPPRSLGDRYFGNSCIEHCIVAGHEQACTALITHGCDLNTDNILSKVVQELCSIDLENPSVPEDIPNPTVAQHGDQRLEFLIAVFHSMVAQPTSDKDAEYEGKTPIRWAVELACDDTSISEEVVSALINAGADVNKNHAFFHTIRELCSPHLPVGSQKYLGLFKIARLLLSKKQKVQQRKENGQIEFREIPVVDVNLPFENKTPLALSWTAGNKDVVELLTQNDARLGASTLFDVMAAFLKNPDDEFANKMSASIINDIILRKESKRKVAANIDYQRNGQTPLILGILARHEGLVLGESGLFAAGADANICAPFNKCLEELKRHPEDRDFLEKVAVYLLDKEADVDAGNQRGFSQAVAARSYIAFMLVQDKKAQHSDLFDVLHEHIETEDEEVRDYLERLIIKLIEAEVGINQQAPGDNETAFTLSIMADHVSFIDELLNRKCNLHDAYPFHKAIREIPKAANIEDPDIAADRIKFLEYVLMKLLEHSDAVNEVYEDETPLTCAIKNDARTFANNLLKQGEAVDYTLCSPIDVALDEANAIHDAHKGEDIEDDSPIDLRLRWLHDVILALVSLVEMSSGSDTLIKAINTGRVGLVRRMINAEADVNFLAPLAHCLNFIIDPEVSGERQQDMTDIAMLLLENEANPNVFVGDQAIPGLTAAARSGNVRLTTEMIRRNKQKESFDEVDQDGRPALHRFLHWLKETNPSDAAKIEFWEKTLLELIACVDADSLNTVVGGFSPLDIALATNNSVVCSALLHRGAQFGPSALVDTLTELKAPDLAPSKFEFYENTACELIANKADVNNGVGDLIPVQMVFEASSAAVFQSMVNNGLDLDARNVEGQTVAQFIAAELAKDPEGPREDFLGAAAVILCEKEPTVLHEILDKTCGSQVGSKVALQLIEEGEVDVAAVRVSDGATAMHCAALSGQQDVVRTLLMLDTDVNAVNNYNQTSLAYAAANGHLECVSLLLDRQADPSIAGGQYLTAMTPLHEAALVGDADVCQYLLDYGAPVNATAFWKRTALHLAVVGGIKREGQRFNADGDGDEAARFKCVQVLVDAGCNVNARDVDDETGLSYAVERNYRTITEMLLNKGADPCQADIHGDTPVHHCVENHNEEIFQSLLASKPNELELLGLLPPVLRAGFRPGIEPLAQPCGNLKMSPSLEGWVGSGSVGGWVAPLWNAVYFGQTATAETLLNQVSDLDTTDHAGFTLLHRLVHWGESVHTSFIPTLLARGASPDVRDRNNWTPLQVAARLGNIGAANALKAGGAVASDEDIQQSTDNKDCGVYLLSGAESGLPTVADRNSLDAARNWCSQNNTKYLDLSFQPNLRALTDCDDKTELPARYHDVEWVRAGEACSGSFLGAFDVTAESLGDPFFIATLPDDPSAAFTDTSASEHGVYEVRVEYMGQQHTVLIDDFVPAIDGKPISACSTSGMMWPLIYEKACAKVAGCYQALSALRHNEASVAEDSKISLDKLPIALSANDRRDAEIHNFVAPAIAAATLSGFGDDIARFASYFSEQSYVAEPLDIAARPLSLGAFDQLQFPLRSPCKIIKINLDTTVRIECSYSQAVSGQCQVALCVFEMAHHSPPFNPQDSEKWRLIRGNVSKFGQTSVVIETKLDAQREIDGKLQTGYPFLVVVGTPVNNGDTEPDLELEILADNDTMEIRDA